jgi:hypothetical protein
MWLADDLRAVAKVLRANRTPEAAALVKKAWPLLLHTTNQPQDSLSQDQVRQQPCRVFADTACVITASTQNMPSLLGLKTLPAAAVPRQSFVG